MKHQPKPTFSETLGSRSIIPYKIVYPYVSPIIRIQTETPTIKSYQIKAPAIAEEAEPGQFVMVWIPSVDEIPMSISWIDTSTGIIEFAAREVGDATTQLHNLSTGMRLGLRGPLGKGYTFPHQTTQPILIAAGGCGSAPLLFAAQRAVNLGHEIHVILGASTKAELLYRTQFTELASSITLTTDDGSTGIRGTTIDGLVHFLKLQKTHIGICLGCGPESMLKALIELCLKHQIQTQVSLERYMKCGVGLCGHCIIDDHGTRVCTEGPVFDGKLLHNTDFGKLIRDGTGRRIPQ